MRNDYAVIEGIYRKGNTSIDRGARHWNSVHKVMMEDAKKIRNYLELRYEDMVEDHQGVSEK